MTKLYDVGNGIAFANMILADNEQEAIEIYLVEHTKIKRKDLIKACLMDRSTDKATDEDNWINSGTKGIVCFEGTMRPAGEVFQRAMGGMAPIPVPPPRMLVMPYLGIFLTDTMVDWQEWSSSCAVGQSV